MTVFLQLLGVAVLILLNGFFVAAEYSLVTVRRVCWEPPHEPSVTAVSASLAGYGARRWQIEQVAPLLAEAMTP